MNSASSARNRNTELAAVDDPTTIPPKKKRLTNTHCQRRILIETTSKSSLCTLIRVLVFTIIFIYLNNMDSVSSTGDRDVQPAAVDD